MADQLILRRQSSRHTPEWDRDHFWSVICEETVVGSIVFQGHVQSPAMKWSWSITISGPASKLVNKSGYAESREAAMAAFRHAWDIYRPEIGDKGWQRHLAHCAWLDEQQARWDRQRAGTEPCGYG